MHHKTIGIFYSNLSKSSGVRAKNAGLKHILEKNQFNVTLFEAVKIFSLRETLNAVRALRHSDVLYVRESLSFLLYFLVFTKRKKIIVEVNREYRNFSGLRSRFFLKLRWFMSIYLYQRCDHILCVTPEIYNSYQYSKFSTKATYFPNVQIYETLRSYKARNIPKEFDFVFIGDLHQPWQGVDIISHLAERYAILIIGKCPQHVASHKNVKFLGEVNDQVELCNLACKARVGLSALNMRIRNVRTASILKHAIYVNARIPIVSSVLDPLIPSDEYPYHVLDFNDFIDFDILDVVQIPFPEREPIYRHISYATNKFLALFTE